MINTIESNKLLAEFMGCYQNNEGFWGFENTPNHKRWHTDRFLDCTKYDTDWSWLMEVVEKIENSKYVDEFFIKKCSVLITPISYDTFNFFHCTLKDETKIQTVYNACLLFIEWYNEQNK